MGCLFLPDIHIDRRSPEVPVLTYLILQETLVWFLHILWQIRVEHEGGHTCVRYLHHVLNLDVLTLQGWRWRCLDDR